MAEKNTQDKNWQGTLTSSGVNINIRLTINMQGYFADFYEKVRIQDPTGYFKNSANC